MSETLLCGGIFKNAKHNDLAVVPSKNSRFSSNSEANASRFSSNSEAKASKLHENHVCSFFKNTLIQIEI